MVVDFFSQHHGLMIHIWHESVSDNFALTLLLLKKREGHWSGNQEFIKAYFIKAVLRVSVFRACFSFVKRLLYSSVAEGF